MCKKKYWNSEFLDIDTYLRFLSPFIPFLHSSETHVNTDEQKDLSNEVLAETERKQISRKEGCIETKIKKCHIYYAKIREKRCFR